MKSAVLGCLVVTLSVIAARDSSANGTEVSRMAMKFYNVEKVAELLGISPADVNAMRERQELHGYRDGADWKFKADDIDRLVEEGGDEDDLGGDDQDVILSEVELGQSNPSTSGTIIGPPPAEALGSSLSGFENLDLTIAESGLGISGLDLAATSNASGLSELDLAGEGLDDDDLVLGASSLSGSGSDLTIGGDSGISLLDPTDSGLSLEEPLDLVGGSQESLVLGEDVLSVDEPADSASITELAGESDFALTPMDELLDGDEDSSSQVIALEGEGDSGEVAPMMLEGEIDQAMPVEMALDDGIAEALPLTPVAAGSAARPEGIVTDYGEAAQQAAAVGAALPEAPYSVLNIVGLAFCTIVLMFVGMMMYDLMRNMWSWNQPMDVNSALMDLILRR
ncbi:MAG: helix-turn-helix domain-containing protein [Pirellulaceae bacterium]|nr:helix-turn-helix domain-containing protein [Pirellulaceae bacterium]